MLIQKIKQTAADTLKVPSLVFAAVCTLLILSVKIIYTTFPPSWLRLGVLVFLCVILFFMLNSYRLYSFAAGLNCKNISPVNFIKENILLNLFYWGYLALILFIVLLEAIFAALIRTDLLYFIIAAVFTAILCIMFFFTFIAAAEFEYVLDGYNCKKLFAFKNIVSKYTSDKLARFTFVTFIELGLFYLLIISLQACSNIFLNMLLVYAMCCLVLILVNILEKYKITVYKNSYKS